MTDATGRNKPLNEETVFCHQSLAAYGLLPKRRKGPKLWLAVRGVLSTDTWWNGGLRLRAKKNNAAGSVISLFPCAQTGVHIGLRCLHTSTKVLRAWSWRELYPNCTLFQDSRACTYRILHRPCNTSLQRNTRCSSHHYRLCCSCSGRYVVSCMHVLSN